MYRPVITSLAQLEQLTHIAEIIYNFERRIPFLRNRAERFKAEYLAWANEQYIALLNWPQHIHPNTLPYGQ